MGLRLLKRRIVQPLRSIERIQLRLNKVERLYREQKTLSTIREHLSGMLDLERLSARVAMEKAHSKDLFCHQYESLKAFLSSRGFRPS
jgi:DNA mismatch repair protein MutS